MNKKEKLHVVVTLKSENLEEKKTFLKFNYSGKDNKTIW